MEELLPGYALSTIAEAEAEGERDVDSDDDDNDDDDEKEEDSNVSGGPKLLSNSKGKGALPTAAKVVLNPPFYQDARLLHYIYQVFQAILTPSSLPSNPLLLRLAMITMITHCMCLLSNVLQLGGRLRSYAYFDAQTVEAESGSNRGSGSGSGAGGDLRNLRLLGKLLSERGLSTLLSLLNDTSDAVRMASIQAIAQCAPLLMSTKEEADVFESGGVSPRVFSQYSTNGYRNSEGQEGEGIVSWKDALRARADGSVTGYTKMVSQLLKEITLSANQAGDDAFYDNLDSTLRSLCVLEPSTFEALVREEYKCALASRAR